MSRHCTFLSRGIFCFLFAASLLHAMDIYLIGGQSNATGQGYMQNLDSAKIAAQTSEFPHPFQIDQRVQFYYIKGTGLNNGKPQMTWMPLVPCSEDPIRFGPEIGFGNRMMQLHPKDTIGIIKYAKSGASLSVGWNPGNSATDTTQWGPEFKWFAAAVNGGLTSLKSRGVTPRIRGMLWQQGESDTGYDHYATMLGHFIDRVRNQWNVPNMLFVYGYVYPADPANVIRNAERDVDQNSGTKYAKSKAFVVWSQDLELRKNDPWLPDASLKTDALHFGTGGILELGRRMADTMSLRLENTAIVKTTPVASVKQAGLSVFPGKDNSVGISYTLASGGPVAIDIYTARGQRVWSLSDAYEGPGLHTRICTGPAGLKGAFIVGIKSANAVQTLCNVLVTLSTKKH